MEKNKKIILKGILFAVLVVILIFAIMMIRNFIILRKLTDLSKDFKESKNFIAKRYDMQGKNLSIAKTYSKDGKTLTYLNTIIEDSEKQRKVTAYKDETNNMMIIAEDEKKILLTGEHVIIPALSVRDVTEYYNDNVCSIMLLAVAKIKTERCNDTDCYMVELADDMKIWYSKETGLIVREINGSYVYNYYYEFDKVQENDIQKPDTTGCIIPE